MSEKSKKVGEIFSDYNTNSNIKYAEVIGLNVVKKINTLEVILYFDEYKEIKEIWYLEKFLRERFQFQNVDIKIKYHDKVEKKSIKNEWKNIIAYMAHKYPLTKPMLLLKSDLEVENQEITIKMHIKGADFLKAKKTDKELIKVLKNLFGIDYKIELIEELSKEEIMTIKEKVRQEEAEIVAHIEEANRQHAMQKEENPTVPEYNDVDYQMPTDIEGYIPNEDEPNIQENESYSETQEYIMGKSSKAKEKHVNIKDITANDGKVTLEGRILTSEVRETRSGKGMLIFDLYDGTGTITIKSFAKDLKEGQEMIEKIKNAKAIKIMNEQKLADVIILARGGGSLEDLWPFNEEIVARAIYDSELPVISAVGHETDFSISDFVADLRAPTPSAAAELAVPNISDILLKLQNYNLRYKNALKKKIEIMKLRYEKCMMNKVFKDPLQNIHEKYISLDMINKSLQNSINNKVQINKTKMVELITKLDSLSPLKTLTRGYSILEKDNKIVKSVKSLNINDEISIRLIDGKAKAKVIDIKE